MTADPETSSASTPSALDERVLTAGTTLRFALLARIQRRGLGPNDIDRGEQALVTNSPS